MELNDIKLFYEVARLNSMAKAANKLNLNRSYVTKRINALEKDLGVSLFFRFGKGVFLTKEGNLFKTHSEQIRFQLLVMEKELHNSQQQIDIGLTPELANNRLNLTTVKLPIVIHTESHEQLMDMFLLNKLDFLITDQTFSNKYFVKEIISETKQSILYVYSSQKQNRIFPQHIIN